MTIDALDDKWAKRLERERAARRHAEQLAEQGMRELWLANQTLERKVQERTGALDRSLAALARSSAVRTALLADLGHELATPLHVITAGLELIDRRSLTDDDRERLQLAGQAASRLDGVLQALLAVAQVAGSDTEFVAEARRPADFLDELVARWQYDAARRGLLLVGELHAGNEPVESCWQRLSVAADAVLDAAVQQGAGGPLRVQVAEVDGELQVTIEDPGPPLPSSAIDAKLPTPLTWATAGRRGIGLAIAQRLADESPMRLSVGNTATGGVRSILNLPITPQSVDLAGRAAAERVSVEAVADAHNT